MAIYGSFRGWQPRNFRTALQASFLILGTLIVAGQGMSGMWTLTMGRLYPFSLPAIAAAAIVGTKLQNHSSAAKFHRYEFLLVAALGVLLLEINHGMCQVRRSDTAAFLLSVVLLALDGLRRFRARS